MLVNLYAFPGLKKHDTADPQFELGAIAIVNDRVWRYVKATATIAANTVVVCESPAAVSNITTFNNAVDETVGKKCYVEDSGEAMTPGIYKGCYLYISGNTGVGLMKRILGNTATRIEYGAMYPELGETDPFSTAPDITTDYNIITPWHIHTADANDQIQTVIGYAPIAITSLYYGWVLCSGMGNPNMYGTGVIDTLAIPGGDTAGEGTMAATSDDLGDATPFGVTMYAGATNTKWPLLFRGISL